MPTLNFAADVDAWTRKTEKRMTAVFRESVERLKDAMQKPVGAGGNMPIDTGFLRNSLLASTSAMPALSRTNPGRPVPYADETSLVIGGLDIGETIYFGYTANYAGHVEYGAQGRPPRRFVGLAAQQWQGIVSAVAAEARARVEAR